MAAVALLAAAILAATLLAANVPQSLFGSLDRSQGALTLLSYLIICFLTAQQKQSTGQAWRLLKGLIIGGGALTAVGLLQLAGLLDFGLVTDARSAVYATLGRSNFVAAYLVMILPLTLTWLLQTADRQKKGILLFLWVMQLILLLATQARSAWIATAVSLSIFALLWRGQNISRFKCRLLWIFFMSLLVLVGFVIFWSGSHDQGSGAARRVIWQGTLELAAARPLTGYGPDSLSLIFPSVFPPELVYYQGREFYVDRAHNLFLDWAVTTGVVGLALYLLIIAGFVLLIRQQLQRATSTAERLLPAAVLAAVCGNVVNNLASFEVTATAVVSWMLIGMAAGLSKSRAAQSGNTKYPAAGVQRVSAGFITLILLGGIVLINGRFLQAELAAKKATVAARLGDKAAAVQYGQQAVAFWPLEPVYYQNLGWYLTQAATKEESWHQAEKALVTARHLQPTNINNHLILAEFYAAAPSQYLENNKLKTIEAYAAAAALAPNHATIFATWGEYHLHAGEPAAALPLLRKAVTLDASNGRGFVLLGEAASALGHDGEAQAAFREAVRLKAESAAP